jgi:hypothetical protein
MAFFGKGEYYGKFRHGQHIIKGGGAYRGTALYTEI